MRGARSRAWLALLALAACHKRPAAAETSFGLPPELTEVSGLAVAGPDSVFTHDDEHAIVYELRLANGGVARAFALGNPTIDGDFEGIATAHGLVYLVSSDGLIYRAAPGKSGKRVPFKLFDTGVGVHCEVEGLAEAPQPDTLLILCKRLRDGSRENRLEIYAWRVDQPEQPARLWLSRPLKRLLDKSRRADFQPSGLEWDPVARRIMVISARNRVVLILDAAGNPIARERLDAGRHPKTEGIAIMPDGRLVLADEGSRTREARLTVYASPYRHCLANFFSNCPGSAASSKKPPR